MPRPVDQPARDGSLGREELELLQAYIERAQVLEQPSGAESKAIVVLKRTLREIKKKEREERSWMPPPEVAQLYGNYQLIPFDWRPSTEIAHWLDKQMQAAKAEYDLEWLVAEFISYWRGRGQRRANWQQAFRNNILQKLGRGMSFGPAKGNGSEPGWPRTTQGRIWDRGAELRKQRLEDFDREASQIVDDAKPGERDEPTMGQDDGCTPRKHPDG